MLKIQINLQITIPHCSARLILLCMSAVRFKSQKSRFPHLHTVRTMSALYEQVQRNNRLSIFYKEVKEEKEKHQAIGYRYVS